MKPPEPFLNRFPVAVLKIRVPDSILKDMTMVTDLLLKQDDGRWDYSRSLAGRIVRGAQIQIPPREADAVCPPQRIRIFQFLWLAGRLYLGAAAKNASTNQYWQTQEVELDDAWCVSQLAGDFNPLHGHDGLLSGVVYLKVPAHITPRNGPGGQLRFRHSNPVTESFVPADGQEHLFDFVHGPAAANAEPVVAESCLIEPVVGDCWLFPSWLLHEVAAFADPGERRSMAFNIRKCRGSARAASDLSAKNRITEYSNPAAVSELETRWERLIFFAPPHSDSRLSQGYAS